MSPYRQPGDILEIPAPEGGVLSGRMYLVGALALVALHTASTGQLAAFAVNGVWELEKPAGISFTVGELAFYDTTGHQINKAAAGRVPVGAVIVAAASADTTAYVRLFAQSTAVME